VIRQDEDKNKYWVTRDFFRAFEDWKDVVLKAKDGAHVLIFNPSYFWERKITNYEDESYFWLYSGEEEIEKMFNIISVYGNRKDEKRECIILNESSHLTTKISKVYAVLLSLEEIRDKCKNIVFPIAVEECERTMLENDNLNLVKDPLFVYKSIPEIDINDPVAVSQLMGVEFNKRKNIYQLSFSLVDGNLDSIKLMFENVFSERLYTCYSKYGKYESLLSAILIGKI
jgi:hypothetical protein